MLRLVLWLDHVLIKLKKLIQSLRDVFPHYHWIEKTISLAVLYISSDALGYGDDTSHLLT
jgi:hypothetical protein